MEDVWHRCRTPTQQKPDISEEKARLVPERLKQFPDFTPRKVLEFLPECELDISILNEPPWSDPHIYALAFQYFLVILWTTMLPSLTNAMGAGNVEKAEIIQSSLFVTALNTLLELNFGSKLPVVMRRSHAFTVSVVSIALSTRCDGCGIRPNRRERFKRSVRRVQGASIISSICQMIIGLSPITGFLERNLSPLVYFSSVTLFAFQLYSSGFPQIVKCVEIGLPAFFILVFSTQYLPHFIKSDEKQKIVERYAVTISMVIVWIFAEILTLAGAYNDTAQATQANCRTDRSGIIPAASWIKIPYPFQWGTPTIHAGDVFPMVVAGFVALMESTAGFIATSRLARAPNITEKKHQLRRAFVLQGVGSFLEAIFGTGNGSATSVESIGLEGLTRVGSKKVVQVAALFMLLFSFFGKFVAVLASIPLPIVAALSAVLFPFAAAAGLDNLQFCNTNTYRSKFILGISLFMALSVPQIFSGNDLVPGQGSNWFKDFLQVICSSAAAIAMAVTLLLDLTYRTNEVHNEKDTGKLMKTEIETLESVNIAAVKLPPFLDELTVIIEEIAKPEPCDIRPCPCRVEIGISYSHYRDKIERMKKKAVSLIEKAVSQLTAETDRESAASLRKRALKKTYS